ncbi:MULTISPECIES: YczE/YyaS/YitT family protein [unclassified Jeotgalibaca]|uniref:YczE/YyaS/YitT family protein n=1 Tax=unclassified Jeotgalibaca TaxID=2621505 RepID=UPI003FD29D96
MNKNQWNRIMFSLLGVFLIGIAIGIARLADLGTDPFSTFNLGMSATFGLSFGTYLLLVNAIGLVLVFIFGRHLLGIGTIFNIAIVGYVSDFTVSTILGQFGDSYSLAMRILFAVIGSLVLAIGAGMYIAADRGVAPYDAMPIIIEERSNGKISFQVARIISDIICIIIGFLLGATVGVVTVVSGFLMGPLVQHFRKYFSDMLLESEQLNLKKDAESV